MKHFLNFSMLPGVFLRTIAGVVLLAAGFATAAGARPTSVRGIVTDNSGEALVGATVQEKGTRNIVASDASGRFALRLTSSRPVLEVRYIGYDAKTVAVTSAEMTIVLTAATEDLDEVVVVAYGTQKKATVTGSIASVDAKELVKSSAPNVSAALAGKLPGLTTIQSNGAPGKDEVQLYLRGAATTNDKNPLILVDGIPRETIREIDANEIQTISVLKDASATAVFGVRGANGVILITTKRGGEGTVNVNTSVRYSLQMFNREPFRHDSWDYARLLNEARYNDDPTQGPAFTDEEIALFDTWRDGSGPEDPNLRYWYPNTNWSDLYFKDYASMVQANVNASGGSNRLQYFVNAGYVYQGGMYNTESKKQLGYDPQATMNRYNLRTNIDYTFSSVVKASLDVSSFIEKVNGTNGTEAHIWGDAITARTTSPGPLTTSEQMVRDQGTDADGNVLTHPAVDNLVVLDPTQTLNSGYGNMNRSGYTLLTRSGVNAVASLTADLGQWVKGLSVKGLVSFESRGNSRTSATRNFITYKFERNPAAIDLPGVYTYDGQAEEDGQISLSKATASWWYVNLQAQVNYARVFGGVHDVTAMILFNRDKREHSSGDIPSNMIGVSGRATYAYDSRYLAEVNIGYNGSEQFAPDHRFGFFPAFSAGWVLTQESFMKDIANGNYLNHVKLRASVGKVGNDGLGSTRFLYMDNITYTTSDHIPSLGNGGKVYVNMLGNSDIHWETAWKQNYAIDLRLLRNLSLTFDYYIENRTDILIERRTVPIVSGMTSSQLPKVNMGEVHNRGYEITASYRLPLRNDINVAFNGNFSYNSNEVKEADEPLLGEDYAYRLRETGYSLGQGWGYLIDYDWGDGSGFFNSDDDIAASGLTYEVGGGKPHPGDFVYKDLNGDKVIDEHDMAPMANAQLVPKISFGFGMSGQIKGFDFSIMFQGISKYSKYYSGRGIFEEVAPNYFTDMSDERWSEERYAAGLKITSPRLTIGGSTSHVPNSYYYMDASYLRLKNAEIGYTIPAALTRKVGMQQVRVYASGDNLYTWQHLHTKSFDPEQGSLLDYPLMRTWSFGINVQF